MTYAHAGSGKKFKRCHGARRKRRTELLHRESLDNRHLCGRFSFLTIREKEGQGNGFAVVWFTSSGALPVVITWPVLREPT
jgi:hypothetical protein